MTTIEAPRGTSVIGHRRLRKQDPVLLAGEAQFTADVAIPGAHHLPVDTEPNLDSQATYEPANGEAGRIVAAPALMNAIIDALSPVWVHDIDLPASPERVWEAIHTAGGNQ